jgi:hypothetical protein
MNRRSLRKLGLLFLAIVAGGCSAPQGVSTPISTSPGQRKYPAHVGPIGSSSTLLFDRVPGEPYAEDFNFRSNWPSSGTRYKAAETTYYTIYFDDEQGPGFFGQNFIYRSARYSQSGMQQR